MDSEILIDVRGMAAAPGGSKTPGVRSDGTPFLRDAGKGNAAWKKAVARAARAAMNGREPLWGPLELIVTFYRSRPRCHYRTGRHAHQLRPDAPKWDTTAPDLTKLLRSTEDALKGIAWEDDATIAAQHVFKPFSETRDGCRILVRRLEDHPWDSTRKRKQRSKAATKKAAKIAT